LEWCVVFQLDLSVGIHIVMIAFVIPILHGCKTSTSLELVWIAHLVLQQCLSFHASRNSHCGAAQCTRLSRNGLPIALYELWMENKRKLRSVFLKQEYFDLVIVKPHSGPDGQPDRFHFEVETNGSLEPVRVVFGVLYAGM
jgi:hypothetical protein